jgi:anti-sigma B factor antagonist
MDMPPSFHVEVEHDGTAVRVIVSGEIDVASVRLIRGARDKALAEHPSRMLIDLRDVGFIDSSGLKFLLETARISRETRWELQLLKPAASAMKLFLVTGADKHLPFVDSA